LKYIYTTQHRREKSRGQVSCLHGEETQLNEQAATIDQQPTVTKVVAGCWPPHLLKRKKKPFTKRPKYIPEMSNRSAGQQFAFIIYKVFLKKKE
jgi:hypothetical protein